VAFFDWLFTKLLAPPNRGPRGEALSTVVARRFDDAVARARAAAKLDLPSEAPDDALPYSGRDRQIERMPGEDLDVYRRRIEAAWVTWSWQGTRYGTAYTVGLFGYGRPVVLTVRDYIIPGWPARQWAVLRLLWTGRATWGSGQWGGFQWGGPRQFQPIELVDTATLRSQLRPVLRKWIGGRDRVRELIIANGAPLWGRVRWGGFQWGSNGPSRRIGPPRWGTARWGAFTWGGFC